MTEYTPKQTLLGRGPRPWLPSGNRADVLPEETAPYPDGLEFSTGYPQQVPFRPSIPPGHLRETTAIKTTI